jgi:hypothetical protein
MSAVSESCSEAEGGSGAMDGGACAVSSTWRSMWGSCR